MKTATAKFSLFLLTLMGSACISQATPVFDLMPLYGIRVNADGLSYKNIRVESEAGLVTGNEIPQGTPFEVLIDEPAGFNDSAGYVSYGYSFELLAEDGSRLAYSNDIFQSMGNDPLSELKNLKLTLTFDKNAKPNSEITIKAKLFDKRGSGWLMWEYKVKIAAAGKKLTKGVYGYQYANTQGLRGASVGLHYNFFEFKSKEGNRFLYKVEKGNALEMTLRGLEGWKVEDGKAAPLASVTLLDATNGIVLEKAESILDKSVQKGMPGDKKELPLFYKPGVGLESGHAYMAWIKIRDQANPKNVLDLVVKFYVD